MAHVNYKRGESRQFVFRREHGYQTYDNCFKGKRDSIKDWKSQGNRAYRGKVREYLNRVLLDDAWWTECAPEDYEVRNLWDLW